MFLIFITISNVDILIKQEVGGKVFLFHRRRYLSNQYLLQIWAGSEVCRFHAHDARNCFYAKMDCVESSTTNILLINFIVGVWLYLGNDVFIRHILKRSSIIVNTKNFIVHEQF